jgi:hypothetical protein
VIDLAVNELQRELDQPFREVNLRHTIVSDAGPILSFARSGLLELLRSVVGELIIPTAVQNELWTRGRTKISAVAIVNEEWIKE